MKYLTSIEDKIYLLWQLEVQLKNFEELGEIENFIGVILLNGVSVSPYAKELLDRYPKNIYVYENKLDVKGYVAAHKPYGVHLHLKEHPEHGIDLVLLDSDILFREKLDLAQFEGDEYYYLADTVSYIGYDYMSKHLTDEQIEALCSIVGIDLQTIKDRNSVSGGGTYFIRKINHYMCLKIALDSVLIYHKLKEFETSGSEIQVWTAEMWSWLWNIFLIGDTKLHEEFNFSWATDSMEKVNKYKTLHLAGVTDSKSGLFYKGMYLSKRPWEHTDFSYVTNKDSGSSYYLEYVLSRFT